MGWGVGIHSICMAVSELPLVEVVQSKTLSLNLSLLLMFFWHHCCVQASGNLEKLDKLLQWLKRVEAAEEEDFFNFPLLLLLLL